jgi:hypothetical protein
MEGFFCLLPLFLYFLLSAEFFEKSCFIVLYFLSFLSAFTLVTLEIQKESKES